MDPSDRNSNFPVANQTDSVFAVPFQSARAIDAKITFAQLWLSFHGRIPRMAYWVYGVLPLIAVSFFVGIVARVLHWQTLSLVLSVLLVWPSLALAAKRWHDRDKSAWWLLIGFVPFIGQIWSFVELGCLRGTLGPNRFGDDPTGIY